MGVGGVTENVSRLNQVFHMVRGEAGYLSNDCFRGRRRQEEDGETKIV